MNEIPRCLIPGEGFSNLAGDPLGCGVGSNVDPYQVASLKPDDHLCATNFRFDNIEGEDRQGSVAM